VVQMILRLSKGLATCWPERESAAPMKAVDIQLAIEMPDRLHPGISSKTREI